MSDMLCHHWPHIPYSLVSTGKDGTAAKNERIASQANKKEEKGGHMLSIKMLCGPSFFSLSFVGLWRIRLPLDPLTYQSWNRMPVHLSLLSLACDDRPDG